MPASPRLASPTAWTTVSNVTCRQTIETKFMLSHHTLPLSKILALELRTLIQGILLTAGGASGRLKLHAAVSIFLLDSENASRS